MFKISKNLRVVIAGLPDGVRAAVFDERTEKDGEARELLNEDANFDGVVQTELPRTYDGVPVKVVVLSAGFLPYEYQGVLEPGIGLFHAARLEVDRVYSGSDSEVPENWDSAQEHRRAEEKVQVLYRQLRKDNPRERRIKLILDVGGPIIGALVGLPFGVVGAVLGLAVGYFLARIASKYAIHAIGLD